MTRIRDFLRTLRFRLGAAGRGRHELSPAHPDGSLRYAHRQSEPVLILQDAIRTSFTDSDVARSVPRRIA